MAGVPTRFDVKILVPWTIAVAIIVRLLAICSNRLRRIRQSAVRMVPGGRRRSARNKLRGYLAHDLLVLLYSTVTANIALCVSICLTRC